MPVTSSSSFTSKRPVLVNMPCRKGAVPCQGCDQSELPVNTSTRILCSGACAHEAPTPMMQRTKPTARSFLIVKPQSMLPTTTPNKPNPNKPNPNKPNPKTESHHPTLVIPSAAEGS